MTKIIAIYDNFVIAAVLWQKNSSFVNFGLQGRIAAVCKCAVLWVGFLFARGRKNKINSLKFAQIYQRLKSFFIIY